MTWVVDASVAVKWLVMEADHLIARSLFDRNQGLHAPDFVFVEVANVPWKKVQRREVIAEQASEGVESLPRIFETIVRSDLLVAHALQIAIQLAHPVYDCLYLACAERDNADLVTADLRRERAIAPLALAFMLSPSSATPRVDMLRR